MIPDFKIEAFQKPISNLPDVPQLSAPELKAYFDASPEELKKAVNGTIDTLSGLEGAKNIGFLANDKVHADTVQAAIENVQGQIKDVVLGQIPEGSIDETRLSQAVLDRMAAEETTRAAQVKTLTDKQTATDSRLTTEINGRTSAEAAINSKINSLTSAVNSRVQVVTGTFSCTGYSESINLGFRPKLVLVVGWQKLAGSSGTNIFGISIDNANTDIGIRINDKGFYTSNTNFLDSVVNFTLNRTDCTYIAFRC